MQVTDRIDTDVIKAVQSTAERSPFYKELFGNDDLHKLLGLPQGLSQLPFTTKQDLAERNEDFLAVPQNEVFDIVTTSGTTGNPVSFYLTRSDLDRLARNECQSLTIAGANASDRFQLMTTMNKQFMAGLAYYEGIKKLGAGILRVGPGSIKNQWDNILKHKPTYLIAIPSFIPALIHEADARGIDYRNSSVRGIICIGEPIRTEQLENNALCNAILSAWDVKLYSTYASTEMATAYTECEFGKGCHEQTDLIYTEVVDENGVRVKNGEVGEVVITTIGVEAMPLVRYKTGDLCPVFYDTCDCGRGSLRLGPVVGRKDHRIKLKGTTIYPRAIQMILAEAKVWPYNIIIGLNADGTDSVTILCSEQTSETKLYALFDKSLSVKPEVRKVSIQAINKVLNWKSSRKPRLVIDIRNDDEAKGLIGSLFG